MKQKVAFLTLNATIPSRKAHSVSTMNVCSKMAEQGLDVELIIPLRNRGASDDYLQERSIWDFYELPKNFKITYLPCPYLFARFKYTGYALFAVFYTLLKRKSLIYSIHIELAFWAAFFGKKSVFESHDYHKTRNHPLLPFWIKMFKRPWRQVAMVVTTHAGAKAYEKKGIPPEKMFVAPNGVDIEKFSSDRCDANLRNSLGLPKNMKIAGFCGHLYEGRGIEEILECAELVDDIFYLIVGGDAEDVHRCESLAKKRGLSNIKFTGFVPPASVPAYIQLSDILIMPYTEQTDSHNFMSPMKMFDYMASGRPIVSTDFPVVREILHDRKNAVLVPPGSGKELASGLKWLLDNPESAEKIGRCAKQDVEQYSWENRTRRVVSWLKEGQFIKKYSTQELYLAKE